MKFYEINICQAMTFMLYTVYNKHEMLKLGDQTRGKLQVTKRNLEIIHCNCKPMPYISHILNAILVHVL